jgi:hypothetical protein
LVALAWLAQQERSGLRFFDQVLSQLAGVRDTKDPAGGTLLIAPTAFAAFLRAARS